MYTSSTLAEYLCQVPHTLVVKKTFNIHASHLALGLHSVAMLQIPTFPLNLPFGSSPCALLRGIGYLVFVFGVPTPSGSVPSLDRFSSAAVPGEVVTRLGRGYALVRVNGVCRLWSDVAV